MMSRLIEKGGQRKSRKGAGADSSPLGPHREGFFLPSPLSETLL